MTDNHFVQIGYFSDKGLRPINEDCCSVHVPDEASITTKGIVALIADGVSSCEAGQQASHTCVSGFLNDYYSTPDSWTVKHAGQQVIGALNRWLHASGHNFSSSAQGMLTTFSALVIKSSTAHIFHVGDSRIFHLRGNDIECLTRDHHQWNSGSKSYLCRAMGADVNIEVDYLACPIQIGDTFLMTTDGIHEFLSPNNLRDIYHQFLDRPDAASQAIAAAAIKAGSDDNVTCQIIRINQLPRLNEDEFYQQLAELPFPPELETGLIFEGYKIIRELHASSRSQVYLARNLSNDEEVALKTPSRNFLDDPLYIDRFLHEEWVARRVDNTHVLAIRPSTQPRRFLYYVSEYLDGQTLEQWMNDHPCADINLMRGIIEQVIRGVRAFHRLEMLHQDLKPANIMINRDGVVKIIDFGSAHIPGLAEGRGPWISSSPAGTWDYAAPEYFLNKPASNRSDIYSLGVIAYEMLSGQLPYGKIASVRSLTQARYTSLRDLNDAVPAWVDAAIEKATQINPELRYSTLSEFFADLCKPNPALVKKNLPLIQKSPLAFWKTLAGLLLLVNFLLLFALLHD
ncbi:MAG: protein kinase [Gammaproteobacteria bacterium]|nr:protein kinase [Gammaproteobacteria bacterium]